MWLLKKYVLLTIILFFVACQHEAVLEDHGPAKNFILYDTDSVRHDLAEYQGKIVMIHFWADWCPNCRGEFPRIQKAYEKLKSADFEILGINSGQSKAHVQEIRETYELTYPLLVDKKTETAKAYGVAGLPSTFFVDKAGKIVRINVGWLDAEEIISTYKMIKNEGLNNPGAG